jgi:hypothetical protein|tara:strand:- start:141 stop:653 length:513 start_codon:yes stop_codon:yes gene_type:complete
MKALKCGIFKSKKGNLQDLIVIPVFLFIIAFSFVLGFYIYGEMNTEIQASDMTTTAKSVFGDNYATYNSVFDNIFLFIMVGLGLTVVVSSFFIRAHPIFYFVSLIVYAFITMISAILSNAYEELIGTTLAAAGASFPIIDHLMSNFPYYMMGLSFVVAIVLYAKRGDGVF